MSKCLAKKNQLQFVDSGTTIQILIITTYGQVICYLFQFGDYWPMVLNQIMDWSDLILVDLVFDICFVVYSNYLGFLAMWIKTQVYIHTYLKKKFKNQIYSIYCLFP